MRKKMKKFENRRERFFGTFVKHGVVGVGDNAITTSLLESIRDSHGEYVTNHAWFKSKLFVKLDPQPGDKITFVAGSGQYSKIIDGVKDFEFVHVKDVELLSEYEERKNVEQCD